MLTKAHRMPFACVAFVAAALAVWQPVSGGKPRGNTPTGTIYFELGIEDPLVSDNPLASMNADGGEKTILPLNISSWSDPGYLRHNGIRWFLSVTPVEGEFLPDGSQRMRLEAISEDAAVTLPLFDDPSLWFEWNIKWSKDDLFVSFAAVEWDLSADPPELLGSALYAMPVGFDAIGPLALAPPMRVAADPETISGGADLRRPVYAAHDWSPDHDAIAYSRDGDVHVLDLVSGESRLLVPAAQSPNWSPVDSTICFRTVEINRRIRVLIQTIDAYDLNGSTLKTVVSSELSLDAPQWSPTGSHISYILVDQGLRPGNSNWNYDLYVVGADGRGNTNLTDDIDEWPWLPSWR